MIVRQETPFQKAIEAVESLPFREREEVFEIIRMRLAEDRREEIAANAREAVQAVKEKRAKYGAVEDLKKDLLGGSCTRYPGQRDFARGSRQDKYRMSPIETS